jgi:hypothetical protein
LDGVSGCRVPHQIFDVQELEGMIRTVRPLQLLASLALLLAGLLQPLAAAQGPTCARTHPSADVVQQAGSAVEGVALRDAVADRDALPNPLQPQHAGAASAACSTAAVAAERGTLPRTTTARHLLPSGDLAPAGLLLQSLFRPPRLS